MSGIRLALFADGIVGLSILKFLLCNYKSDIKVVVVISNKEICNLTLEAGIPLIQYESQEQLLTNLPENLDLGLLAWWPHILKEKLLSVPKRGFINTHPSLLPWNKGKHYNFWALVEQSPFGVTIHKVNEGIDSGAILTQMRIEYDWTDTGETLYRKAQQAIVKLFEDSWPKLRSDESNFTPQEVGKGSFHYGKELDSASKIEFERTYKGAELLNLLRARTFKGHPGCWFEDNGDRYEISIEIRKIKL